MTQLDFGCSQRIVSDEGVASVLLENGAKVKPRTAYEVCYDDGNDYQSDDFIDVQHHILSYDLFVFALVVHQRLEHLLEFVNID